MRQIEELKSEEVIEEKTFKQASRYLMGHYA